MTPHRPPIPWGTVIVVVCILVSVTLLASRRIIGGDAAIALYTSIAGYILGATNGSWRTSRRASDREQT